MRKEGVWPRARARSLGATASDDVWSTASDDVWSSVPLPGMGGSASKESFNLGTSESRQREPTSEQGPRTLGLSLHRENRGSCGPHSSRKVQWFLGVRATGNMCWRINTHSITSVNVSGFGLQCCRRTTCLLLAQLKSSEPSAFSGCSRPVVVAKSQLNHHQPPDSAARSVVLPAKPVLETSHAGAKRAA